MIAPLALALALAAAPAGQLCTSPATDAAVCSPAVDPVLRERASVLLGAIHRPASPEDWRRLPAGAREYLEAVASDPAQYPARRARALEGLAALGADGALHQQVAADGSAPFSVRDAAVRGLAAIVAPAEAPRALGALLTSDPDRRIRAAAAEALARRAPVEGCGGVRAQLQREGAGGRPAFRRALVACDGR